MSRRAISPAGVLLAPGAGADRNQSSLLAIERTLSPLPVRRMDFPYRTAGRRAPDRAPVLMAAMADELARFCEELGCSTDAVLLGGRSMGGRIGSMVAAELGGGGSGVAGLALVSYPLHPPGRPDRLRTAHLPSLDVPVLFISGTRDPFGTPEEFERETAVIPGPMTFRWIDGARHDLRGKDEQVAALIAEWIAEWIATVS